MRYFNATGKQKRCTNIGSSTFATKNKLRTVVLH